MHFILVVQEMSAWNEASRMFMFLLRVNGESQLETLHHGLELDAVSCRR